MKEIERVAKVARIVPLKQAKSDFAYWQRQSFAARLEALEEIRREYHRWKYNAEPGFQRVYQVVKR
jgi:hypothetical protein